MDGTILAFIGVSLAVILAPGPDTLLVMRNTLAGGRAAGAATTLGVTFGVSFWALLAVIGIAAILAASAVAFTVVKLAGAVYLVMLGIMAFRRGAGENRADAPVARSVRAAALQGFMSAALNPKLGVFFLTLLPQFVEPSAGPWASLELAGVFAVIGVSWLLVVTMLVASVGDLLRRPGARRAMHRAAGVVFIALGVRVATERA